MIIQNKRTMEKLSLSQKEFFEKYYNEIQECYYGEGNDEATIKALMQKSRELFSEEVRPYRDYQEVLKVRRNVLRSL